MTAGAEGRSGQALPHAGGTPIDPKTPGAAGSDWTDGS